MALPTLEQINQSAESTLAKAPTMSIDQLGIAWVMAKTHLEKYRKNSPESKALLAFQKHLESFQRKARANHIPVPTALEAELS